MRLTHSRTTALLTTAGAALAVSAAMFAPVAAADDTIACEPGQIVIDGNCNIATPPVQDNFAPPATNFFAPVEPAPMGGGDSVDIGGGGVDVGGGAH